MRVHFYLFVCAEVILSIVSVKWCKLYYESRGYHTLVTPVTLRCKYVKHEENIVYFSENRGVVKI